MDPTVQVSLSPRIGIELFIFHYFSCHSNAVCNFLHPIYPCWVGAFIRNHTVRIPLVCPSEEKSRCSKWKHLCKATVYLYQIETNQTSQISTTDREYRWHRTTFPKLCKKLNLVRNFRPSCSASLWSLQPSKDVQNSTDVPGYRWRSLTLFWIWTKAFVQSSTVYSYDNYSR